MFELHQLEQLVVISETRTLSAAAEKLFISQPALSRSMQNLEKNLGIPLFEHTKKNRISLNPSGEQAVIYAKALLAEAANMQERLRLFHQMQHIFSIGSCAPAPLWNILPYLSTKYPNLTISTELQADFDILRKNLHEKMYKLIITPFPIEESGIRTIPYINERLYLAVPEDHELAGNSGVYLKDLKDMTLILHSRIGFWLDLCRQKMINPNFIFQEDMNNFSILTNSSTLPHFVTDLSDEYLHHSVDKVRVPILDDEANVTFYCSCLAENAAYLPESMT